MCACVCECMWAYVYVYEHACGYVHELVFMSICGYMNVGERVCAYA